MTEDNLTLQTDEIEALSAIYENDWRVVDASERSYSIKIKPESAPANLINLQVVFPHDYPSKSPPVYQLNAPWLRGEDRMELSNCLEEIYLENIGSSIIYLWVEKIREFLGSLSSDRGGDATVGASEQSDTTRSSDLPPETLKDYTYEKYKKAPSADIEVPPIYSGESILDRKSTFQAFLAPVHSKEQVELVMHELLQNKKIANATHNMFAYRIVKEPAGTFLTDCEDDGETHAGSRMLNLLEIVNAKNVLVVVSRWYGHIHLGPDRFKHINNCTRSILEAQGYIEQKDDKKSSKGKKGKHHHEQS